MACVLGISWLAGERPEVFVALSAGNVDAYSLDLWQLARSKTRDELLAYLEMYDVDSLRSLIRRYYLGTIKSKSVPTLAAHIADIVSKRSVDVFLKHEDHT